MLHLREGQDELLSRWKLASIIRKYSDHIALPILMRKEVWDEEEKALPATTDEDETVNQASALWARPKQDITRRAVRGVLQARRARQRGAARLRRTRGSRAAPSTRSCSTSRRAAPFDLCDREHRRGAQALRAARVHHGRRRAAAARRTCASSAASSTPTTCRSTCRARSCRSRATSRRSGAAASSACSTLLEDLADEREGEVRDVLDDLRQGAEGRLRRGPGSRRQAREARCASRRRAGGSDAQDVSLADYVARMKEGQTAIYYVTAESHAAAANSPHLEIFRKKGIEVLLLSDRIDEWVASAPDRVRRQAADARSPRARSTWARSPTPRRRRSRRRKRRR